jgi:1-acyl-sn-glycerol-3-phosphate acyltransferase
VPRVRFASLWLSQVARTLADNCLRMFVLFEVARGGSKASEAAWYQVSVFFILPFLVLAPVNGALSNALPRRGTLAGSAAFCFVASLLLTVLLGASPGPHPWAWCAGLGVVMAGHAVYSPTRYALLPAVAHDTRLSLPLVTGLVEAGVATAVVAGLVLGVRLHGDTWSGVPAPLAAVLALNLFAVVAALPVHFPSDVRRPEPPARAVAGSFRDTARVWQDAEARGTLIGLVGFLGLMVAGAGAVLAYSGGLGEGGEKGVVSRALIAISIGAALGSLLAGLQGHPRRALGLVPPAATGMLLALVAAAFSADVAWPCLALGVTGGILNVPLRAAYQAAVPADARGNGMAVLDAAYRLAAVLLMALLFGLVHLGVLGPAGQLALLAALAAAGALAAWWFLARDSLELLVEILIWPLYRIHGRGPGVGRVPPRGPLIVLANHAAWIDPFVVAKVVPRRLFPMMTSAFFDLPVVHWLMTRVVHAIRVPVVYVRHEAPELKDAIAVLDRGDALLIFPEGWIRRRDDRLLRQFGQGIWHILSQRPQTPVVACWIEGAWGSLLSFRGGPPLKGKPPDLWRRIDVVISEPQVLDPALLKDDRATRTHLMRVCLGLRGELGLEVPKEVEPLLEEGGPV